MILGACLHAFGADAHLSQLVLVNTLVVLFAGLMPVPGGVGVAEAGYIAGLQAIGNESTIAISTALSFRLVTFYLPPLWGVGSDEVAAPPPIRLSHHHPHLVDKSLNLNPVLGVRCPDTSYERLTPNALSRDECDLGDQPMSCCRGDIAVGVSEQT